MIFPVFMQSMITASISHRCYDLSGDLCSHTITVVGIHCYCLICMCLVLCCREKDTDIEFAQDAIDEYKVKYMVGSYELLRCTFTA